MTGRKAPDGKKHKKANKDWCNPETGKWFTMDQV